MLCDHADEVKAMFDVGICAIVRATSNTSALDKVLLYNEKCVGSVDDVAILKEIFIDVDTVVYIEWFKDIVEAAAYAPSIGHHK